MTHPEELLAGYVDGTLEPDERALVEAHLVGCDACELEIEQARGARGALRALPEEPVPLGVTGPVLAELRGEIPEPAREAQVVPVRAKQAGWPAWLPKTLAAAAGFVALVLFAGTLLPRLGESEDRAGGAVTEAADQGKDGAPPETAFATPPLTLETSSADYDAESLGGLAREVARNYLDFAERAVGGDGSGLEALECVRGGASLTDADTPVRVIATTFEGAAAYIGIFLEAPTPGAPPTKVIIWTVARDGCAFVAYGQQRVSAG